MNTYEKLLTEFVTKTVKKYRTLERLINIQYRKKVIQTLDGPIYLAYLSS